MDFADVVAALNQAEVPYVVTGGVAVVLHGFERPVADFDIVIDPTPATAQRVVAVLASRGFVATLPVPLFAVVVMRFLDGQGREVDVNVRYPVPFADLKARAARFTIDGHEVLAASVDDLLAVKTARGRDYDQWDVAGLRGLA